jgi:hypothetical protein
MTGMKTLFVYLSIIVLTYLALAVVNMALVITLFPPSMDGIAVMSAWVAAPLEVAVVALTGYWIPVRMRAWWKPAGSAGFHFALGLTIAVTLANIWLDVSLEPLWYKLVYLVSLVPAYVLGVRRP